MQSKEDGYKKSADEIAQAYSSEPWWYDLRGFFILTFAYNSTLLKQIHLFGENMGRQHLEVACGTGTLLELILRWRRWKDRPVVEITGVDYAESMLAGAVKRFKGKSNMRFLHADAVDMGFDSNSFDTVNVANAIHCLPQVDAALSEIYRVLKPGGAFAANVLLYPRGRGVLKAIAERINTWGIAKGILVTPYDLADVKAKVIAAGFKLRGEEISGNCYNFVAVKGI